MMPPEIAALVSSWRTLDYHEQKLLQSYVACRMLELAHEVEDCQDRSKERKVQLIFSDFRDCGIVLSSLVKREGTGVGL